ncbi:MAG TPA: protein kinase [Candidatus Sulfotelmatobacter sp.]|nr:protein kinase [Candidatus Sulfotelmatobacter sp.]
MVPPKVSKIGKYEVVEVIGRGGMGMVYKAVDPTISRTVAIKKVTSVLSDDPDLLRRFYREAQSTGKLQHPNIVTLYDLGDQDGVPYLVMEYLEGDSLEKIIKERRPFTLAEKLNIIIQVCEGLAYAHQQQIIHRDMKPGNIVVLNDGGVKIVDFGIAQLGNERFTRTGQVVGSLYYMSPEQLQDAEVDTRSDIYSVGVVLYEFLAGTLPFQGRDPTATLAKILHDSPPPLANFLNPYIPELESVVRRALAKDRDERFPTMEDFTFELQSVQEKLSQELIANYLRTAEFSAGNREWEKARDQLRHILKLDKQHRRANELLREVQTQLHKQQIGEQVLQLRSRAEEALGMRRWDDALVLLDQAVRIDGTNSELIRFRDSVRRSSTVLAEALRRAESAHHIGDLDSAKRAVEEALSVDPANTTAKALNAILAKEIAERSKRQMLDDFVISARKEIGMRHFTAALDLLKKAEQVDPSLAEVQQLIHAANTGREHERRRKALELACTEIEDLLNRDQYAAACVKAEEALHEFPDDLGLLKLRSFAERQRDAWTRRQFIESQLNSARQHYDAGQLARAQQLLNEALESYPDDSGLMSFLSIISDALARQEAQRREAERQAAERKRLIQLQLSAAADLRGMGQTAQALQKLRDALARYPDSEELRAQVSVLEGDLAQETAEKERAAQQAKRKREEIDREISNAKQLLASRQTLQAAMALEQALQRYPESDELRSQLEFARRRQAVEQAERQRAEQEVRQKSAEIENAAAQARRLLDSGEPERAIAILQQALLRYPTNENLQSQLESAQRRFASEKAEQEARRRQAWVDREISMTREWVSADQSARAIDALERALHQFPESEKLKSELGSVRERQAQQEAEREKARQEAERQRVERERRAEIESEIATATKLLDAQQFMDAVARLEPASRKFPDSPELRSQLDLAHRRAAEEQQRSAERSRAEAAAAKAREEKLRQEKLRAEEERRREEQRRKEEAAAKAREEQRKKEEAAARAREEQRKKEEAAAKAKEAERKAAGEKEHRRQQAVQSLQTLRSEIEKAKSESDLDAILLRIEQIAATNTDSSIRKLGSELLAAANERARNLEQASRLAFTPTQQTAAPEMAVGAKRIPTWAYAAGALVAAVVVAVIAWPSSIDVKVETNPAGANVTVDGQSCASPCTMKLKPGMHTFHIVRDGFVSTDQQVTIAKSAPNARFTLNSVPSAATQPADSSTPAAASAPSQGTLVVRTNVEGARIFVDDVMKGTTSSDGELRIPTDIGRHQVRSVKDGYESGAPMYANVRQQRESRLEFTLVASVPKSSPSAPVANPYLTLRAEPGAQVRIDGNPAGSVPPGGTLSLQVSPSDHRIEVTKDGYKPWSTTAIVRPGENQSIVAGLEKIANVPPPAVPAKPSLLVLSSKVPGGEVRIDHQLVGRTGDDGSFSTSVAPGQHKVEIAKDGYQPWSADHSFAAGDRVDLKPDLLKNIPATKAKTPELTDSDMILSALGRLEQAYSDKNANEVCAIWRNCPRGLDGIFKQVTSVSIKFQPSGPVNISGDTATLACTRTSVTVYKEGPKPVSSRVTVRLHRQANGWEIESIDTN